MDYSLAGPALAIGLSTIGASIGCGIAGEASHAVMSRVEEGHGKNIAMSALPSSHIIYGFLLMLIMAGKIKAGTLAPMSAVSIGFAVGTAIMFAAIYMGKVCATGIIASAKQPSIYGKCFAAIGIIESFSLFAFVFALLIM